MLGKLKEAGSGDAIGTAARENYFRGGQFNCTVREVIGYYITMEEFYVEEMISKAVRLDELVRSPSPNDDVVMFLTLGPGSPYSQKALFPSLGRAR